MIRCECDRNATHHKANECQNEAKYEVTTWQGVVMKVCGDCTSGDDKDSKRLDKEDVKIPDEKRKTVRSKRRTRPTRKSTSSRS